MTALTTKQQKMLDCIADCMRRSGYAPTIRELGQAAGLSSPSTVQSHLNTLEALGYIRRCSGKSRSITLTEKAEDPAGVPILGAVAAGSPILAVEDALGYLDYTPPLAGEYFALRIKGDSMLNAGILDGDYVVVRRQQTAEDREIVIALLEDEATCKRLRRGGGQVWLMPENENYQPIDGRAAVILGKVTAVIRNYI